MNWVDLFSRLGCWPPSRAHFSRIANQGNQIALSRRNRVLYCLLFSDMARCGKSTVCYQDVLRVTQSMANIGNYSRQHVSVRLAKVTRGRSNYVSVGHQRTANSLQSHLAVVSHSLNCQYFMRFQRLQRCKVFPQVWPNHHRRQPCSRAMLRTANETLSKSYPKCHHGGTYSPNRLPAPLPLRGLLNSKLHNGHGHFLAQDGPQSVLSIQPENNRK